MVNVIKAYGRDLSDVLILLEEVNLPMGDIAEHFHDFLIEREGDRLVGCAGIEIYDDVGLMSSVAVAPTFQGHGLGHKLVERIHRFALAKGLKKIYLITDTAEQFFSKLGYVVTPREDVDPKIKQSVEFTYVCAISGVCMMKILK
jgi:amino-acid N-acetyltransferase